LGQIEICFSISILTSENCLDYATSIFLHGPNILIFGTAWLMVQIILLLVQAWTHDPSIFASGSGFVLWFKQFCLWLRLGLTVQAFVLMVEGWSYGPNNFVYGPSLVVWSKHFCLWSKPKLMIQAFLLMVEVWFYGLSTFAYG
jgi:hypothetical protein